MKGLPWWCIPAAAIALAGCTTTKPETVSYEPIEHTREVLVQTLHRGCWVERNNEYIGVAPIAVTVRTSSRGHPLILNSIQVKHSSGAWEKKVLTTREPVPARMLFDLRDLVGPMLQGPGV